MRFRYPTARKSATWWTRAGSGLHVLGAVAVSPDRGQQVVAGLLAPTARVGADPAVLVHVRVPGALVPTGLARLGAGAEHRAGQLGVVRGLPGQDATGGLADVGAVEVAADASPHVGDRLLAEAGVRAGGARLGALDAGGDTGGERLPVQPGAVGMAVDHAADQVVHDGASFPGCSGRRRGRQRPGVGHRYPAGTPANGAAG